MFKYKKILALSPHTDDIELGCGGTLKKLKEEGAEIHVVNMCLAKPLSEGDITNEFKDSMKLLDIDWCEMMSLPVRNLYKHRQEILDFLIKIHHNNHYDLVFVTPLMIYIKIIKLSLLKLLEHLKKPVF